MKRSGTNFNNNPVEKKSSSFGAPNLEGLSIGGTQLSLGGANNFGSKSSKLSSQNEAQNVKNEIDFKKFQEVNVESFSGVQVDKQQNGQLDL